jgi:hypothetical protein
MGVGTSPYNGGYWGATGGWNGSGGYGTPGMNGGYYNQMQDQYQAQMAMQGQNQAGMERMQGNAYAGGMANQALYRNYQTASRDYYGSGTGYAGGSPYMAGNLSGNFGVNAGFTAGLYW